MNENKKQKLADFLAERTSQGLTTYQRAFETLGLSVEDLLKMPPDQQLAAIAKAISDIDDPAQKASVAMQIFGRQGTHLL